MFTFGHIAAACIAKAIALYRGSILATGDMAQDHLRWTQNVPSITRVAAGAFGFLIFSRAFDGPDLYGALSFFERCPQGQADKLQANILSP
jgi:hypothetical protein